MLGFKCYTGLTHNLYLSEGTTEARGKSRRRMIRSFRCKTYMGVLSLQKWRGESEDGLILQLSHVHISSHNTQKSPSGSSSTASETGHVLQALLSCTTKYILIQTYAH